MGLLDRIRNFRKEARQPNRAVVKPYVFGYSTRGKKFQTVFKPQKFSDYLEVYRSVPDIYASIETKIDQLIYTGFRIEGGTDLNRKKCQNWTKVFDINEFISRFSRTLLTQGNSFLDIRKHPEHDFIHKIMFVDPDTIVIERDKYAEQYRYYQQLDPRNKKFLPNLVHVRLNLATDNEVYGKPDLQSVISVLNAKLNIERDVVSIIHNFAYPILHWKLGTDEFPANKTSVEEFNRQMKKKLGRDIVTGTDVNAEKIGADSLRIDTPIDHYERQIFAGLRIPSFLLDRDTGSPEMLKIQIDNFYRHCTTLASIITRTIEFYIFTKICNVEPDKRGYIPIKELETIPKIVWNDIETIQDKLARVSQMHGTSPMISTDEARSEFGFEDPLELDDGQILNMTNGATNKIEGSGVMNVGNPQTGQNPNTPKQKATPSNQKRNTRDRGNAKDLKRTNK